MFSVTDFFCFSTFFQVPFAPSRVECFFPKSRGFSREFLVGMGGLLSHMYSTGTLKRSLDEFRIFTPGMFLSFVVIAVSVSNGITSEILSPINP